MVPLVGRGAEVEGLRAAIARTESGEGGVVLLVGEPGVGKSRLAQEAAELAGQRGFDVVEGHAAASDLKLAYAPVVAALGRFLSGVPARRRSTLVLDLDDLSRLFVDLALAPPVPIADPALERSRLFGALAALLGRAASDRPVLFCLDDVHWADTSTLELVDFLARNLQDERCVFIVTARDAEAESRPELVAMLRSLRRLGLLQEIPVGRLDAAAVEELTTQILGGAAPVDLSELVAARGGGVPLFITTMIAALIESGQLAPTAMGWSLARGAGQDVPALVRDVILQRLERLPAAERRVIDLIAASGEAVRHAVLVEAGGFDAGALAASMRLLRLARLVAEEIRSGDVVYLLTHPLIGEVAADELSPIEGQQLHGALAGALEQLSPDDRPHLARHYRLAGPGVGGSHALEVLVAAGERARDLYANEEAAANFAAALARAGTGGRCRLLERLGEARLRLGDTGAARAAWQEALDLAQQGSDRLAEARLRGHLAEAEWTQGRMAGARSQLEAGIAAIENCPEGEPQLARLHQSLAALLDRAGDLGELEATVSRLQALAARSRAPEVVAEAALAGSGLWFQRGDFVTSLALIGEAVGAAAAADDRLLRLRALDAASNLTSELGDHHKIRRFAQPALELARQVGSLTSEIRARGCLAVASMLAGRWAEADVELTSVIAFARRADIPRGWARASAMRTQLLVLRGDLAQAESVLAEASAACTALTADRHLMGTLALAEGWLVVELGDFERGRRIETALASPAGGLRPWRLAALGDLMVARGEIDAALGVADQLDGFDDGAGFFRASAAGLRGSALVASARPEEAGKWLAAAADSFDRLDTPWLAAQARLHWAAATDDREPAVEAARHSLACFEGLGARRWADRARHALRQLGVTPAPERRRPASTAVLSRRELEVARLAAQGLTTAEIAGRLVISRHTAATHLQHIYQRLEVHSRVALARFLGDAGML